MSAYRLYTGGPYKQRDGSAITASSTDVNGGAAKNISSSETLTRSDFHEGNYETTSVETNAYSAVPADMVLSQATDATWSNSSGYCTVELNTTHGLIEGQLILINGDSIPTTLTYAKVTSIVNTTTFKIDLAFNNHDINSQATIYISRGNFSSQDADNFIMKKHIGEVHGQAHTKLASGAADYGRNKVHRITAVRTRKVATAIRSGYWNIFTGSFTSTPNSTNDYASMDTDGTNVPDDEAKNIVGGYNVGGEFAYRSGGRTARTSEYERGNG